MRQIAQAFNWYGRAPPAAAIKGSAPQCEIGIGLPGGATLGAGPRMKLEWTQGFLISSEAAGDDNLCVNEHLLHALPQRVIACSIIAEIHIDMNPTPTDARCALPQIPIFTCSKRRIKATGHIHN